MPPILGRLTGIAALALAIPLTTPALAETISFEVALSGGNQVPPVDTAGNGVLSVQCDTDTLTLSWTVT